MVGDSWASMLLKERGIIDRQWCPQHCLFGLHLLSLAESAESADLLGLAESAESAERTPLKFAIRSKISAISAISARQSETICVVESVRSCVVLSERFPKYLWMATGYLANLNERMFLPLKGHHVVCFPATDPTGDTYLLWLSVAKEARKYGIDITVSRLLEDQASPTQKEQCVDLLEFLYNTNLQK